MDNERLGEQRFDEPAGLEQCGIGPRAEDIEHREIRDVIEDRVDRADQQHEFRDVANVPAARHRQVLGVDGVRRNGGLREVLQ